MDQSTAWLTFVVVTCSIFGFVGIWIATQKNRDSGEGFFLGFLLGPIGLLIEAMLPTKAKGGSEIPEHERR